MQKTRIMKVSCFQAICDLFRNPVPGTSQQPSLTQPWTVYTEDDLRNKRLKPVFPYVYLVDHDSQDLNLRAPVIVVNFSLSQHFSYSIGNLNNGKAATLTLHCIGRNKSESLDLASYVAEGIKAINILDYNNPSSSLDNGPYPVLDTRPRLALNSLPTSYYPIIQTLQVDPFVSMGSFKATDKQRFQGMITSSELVQYRFISSF